MNQAISKGALGDVLGSLGSENVQGEVQKKLDVIANDLLLDANEWGGHLAAMASEEMETIHRIPNRFPARRISAAVRSHRRVEQCRCRPVGRHHLLGPARARGLRGPRSDRGDFLQPGRAQVAAGYAIYGPQTLLVLTVGTGVYEFTLDREIGSWRLTDGPMRIPTGTKEFAINMARRRQWSPGIARYIEERILGTEGPLGRITICAGPHRWWRTCTAS